MFRTQEVVKAQTIVVPLNGAMTVPATITMVRRGEDVIVLSGKGSLTETRIISPYRKNYEIVGEVESIAALILISLDVFTNEAHNELQEEMKCVLMDFGFLI